MPNITKQNTINRSWLDNRSLGALVVGTQNEQMRFIRRACLDILKDKSGNNTKSLIRTYALMFLILVAIRTNNFTFFMRNRPCISQDVMNTLNLLTACDPNF